MIIELTILGIVNIPFSLDFLLIFILFIITFLEKIFRQTNF